MSQAKKPTYRRSLVTFHADLELSSFREKLLDLEQGACSFIPVTIRLPGEKEFHELELVGISLDKKTPSENHYSCYARGEPPLGVILHVAADRKESRLIAPVAIPLS